MSSNRNIIAATLACFAAGATLATVSLAPAHPRARTLMVPETTIVGSYVAPEPVFEASTVTFVAPLPAVKAQAPVAHAAQRTQNVAPTEPFCLQAVGHADSCIAGASLRGAQTYTGETPRLGDFSRGHVVGGGL